MTPALYFTVARVTIAGLLFWAVSLPSVNSHLFFRLAIFPVAVWGFYRALKKEAGWFLILFYLLVAAAFNPISSRFEKETWAIIDIASGILLLLSILILDSAPFDTVLKTPGGKRVKPLTSIVFGIAWSLLGVFVIYNAVRNIERIAKLKMNGRETQARITRVTHDLYQTTDANNDSRTLDMYVTEYIFQTEDGRLVAGSAELPDNPVSRLSADEFRAKYSNGFEVEKDRLIPLQVEYEEGNPTNNRALSDGKGAGNTILYAILISLFFGLCPIALGFKVCKENVPELLVEPKTRKPHSESGAV